MRKWLHEHKSTEEDLRWKLPWQILFADKVKEEERRKERGMWERWHSHLPLLNNCCILLSVLLLSILQFLSFAHSSQSSFCSKPNITPMVHSFSISSS